MKKILTRIGIVIAIGLFIYISCIRPDYSWAKKTIDKQTKKDWILVSKAESGDIKPWTWFKAPIKELWFAKRNELLRIDSSTMVGNIYYASYIDDKSEGTEYLELFNSVEYGSHILDKNEDINTINYKDIKWMKQKKGTPGGDLIDYYNSKNKKYFMSNIFGEDIDISNFIITGLYSSTRGSYLSNDTTSKYIVELVNNNPYKPTKKDEGIIRDGISKFLFQEHPIHSIKLDSNLFEKVKYSSSQLGYFDKLQDNYIIKVLPFSGMDSILIEFDFERLSIPLEYQKADEIRIHKIEN
jgi:hypothetical protein